MNTWKVFKIVGMFTIVSSGLLACAGRGGSTVPTVPTEPSEVQGMIEGPVYLDATVLTVKETEPVQIFLHVEGNLPTPCHQLKFQVSNADQEGNIEVEIWSEAPLGQECIQVLAPFEKEISIGTPEAGSFTVLVNGEAVGQVDV